MGASCCRDCKNHISREKTSEFIDENENGNIPIPSEKKVSFSEFNPKKLEKKKTFTENFFGLFEPEKERKSNLKSPIHKSLKKFFKKLKRRSRESYYKIIDQTYKATFNNISKTVDQYKPEIDDAINKKKREINNLEVKQAELTQDLNALQPYRQELQNQ